MILVSALETQCSQCTFVPLPCSMVAMFSCRYSLGYESILRANYRNPLCSDEHSQSTDLEHVETHCRPRFADCSKADMRRLQILATDSILLTFLTRSTSPIYPLDLKLDQHEDVFQSLSVCRWLQNGRKPTKYTRFEFCTFHSFWPVQSLASHRLKHLCS